MYLAVQKNKIGVKMGS